jgi:putative membrane protein
MRTRYALAALLAFTPILAGVAPHHSPIRLDDAAALATFDQVNGFDIETARLGAVRGSSELVRALAADVLRDHSMVLQQARDLAARTGITYRVEVGNPGSRSHAGAMKELARLHGAAFDAAYLRHEIAFHDGAIHAVREVLLPGTTHPDLRALLTTTLPGFEHHLAVTRETARQLGIK